MELIFGLITLLFVGFTIAARVKEGAQEKVPGLFARRLKEEYRPGALEGGLMFSGLLPFNLEYNDRFLVKIQDHMVPMDTKGKAVRDAPYTQAGQLWRLFEQRSGIGPHKILKGLKTVHKFSLKTNQQYSEQGLLDGLTSGACLDFQDSFDPIYIALDSFIVELDRLRHLEDPTASSLWEYDPALVLAIHFQKRTATHPSQLGALYYKPPSPEIPIVLYLYLQNDNSGSKLFPRSYVRPFLLSPFLYTVKRELDQDFWPHLDGYLRCTSNWQGLSHWVEKILAQQGTSSTLPLEFQAWQDEPNCKIILRHIQEHPTDANLWHLQSHAGANALTKKAFQKLKHLVPKREGNLSFADLKGAGEITEA